MEENRLLLLQLARELVWWLIAAVATTVVILPIFNKVNYQYWEVNAVIVFTAILYFLYVIFYRQSLFLRPKWLRFVLFVFNLNFFVFVIRQSQFFISVYDSFTINDLGTLKSAMTFGQMERLYHYFLFETTLGVVTCLAMTAALNARMVHAYWQTAKTRLNGGETS
ncbi:MAG: hypothetical protein U0T73_01970 [Chitinophagales bacterium]